MHELLKSASFTSFQQMFRAADVRFFVDPSRPASKLKGRAQMNDRVAACHCRHDTGAIAKVPAHDPDPIPNNRCAFSGVRQNIRTPAPRARSRRTTWRPINPVPPVIKNCLDANIAAESTSNMNGREVFFIADDFGMSPEANRAIIHAHRHGALHGASLMMGQPATQDAVRLAQENPSLQMGWHLHLCDSQPITRSAWPWGRFTLARGLGHRPVLQRAAVDA